MAKQKKKRNKVYSGSNASINKPNITRIEAVNRNKFSQWWFEKKQFTKPVLIAVGIIFVIIIIIIGIVSVII